MKTRYWTIATGCLSAMLLASCNSTPKQAQAPLPSPQAFSQPIVAPKPLNLPTIKVPGMIAATDSKMLMPVAVSSTRDPFAAAALPTALKASIQPVVKTVQPIEPQSVPLQPVPLQAPTLPQPAPTAPASLGALPTLPVAPPAMPPAHVTARTNLADAIALTGVVQTSNRLSAIVQESDGQSRSVQVGDALANGQVIIKRINLNPGREPSIVLQQNGVEFTKTVGSASS